MNINLGCGRDYRPGWVNIDVEPAACPDIVFDLENTPWPLASNCADVIVLKRVLEHVGRDPTVFLKIIAELYRVAKPDGRIEIHATHPWHGDFLAAPTHVRPIVPNVFQAFDMAVVEQWQASGSSNTPHARYIEVDFETTEVGFFVDPFWLDQVSSGAVDNVTLAEKARYNVNVIQWARIVLRAVKPFRHGRSLDGVGAICLDRQHGIGDVLMVLGAAKALKAMTGKPIYVATGERFRALLETCPFVDGVLTSPESVAALTREFAAAGGVRHANLQLAQFGVSGRHQIDAYLAHFGLSAPPALKEIVLDASLGRAEAEGVLGALPSRSGSCRRVLVHPALGDPNRTWPREKWQALCERLLDLGHQVIVIGGSNGIHSLDVAGITSAVDALSFQGTLSLMDMSDVLISTDSGPVQLAAATSIHIIGIYSVVPAKDRMPFRKGKIGWRCVALEPNCATRGCYYLLPEYINQAIASGIAPDTLRGAFNYCCFNEQKFDCMVNLITLDDVLGAFSTACRGNF